MTQPLTREQVENIYAVQSINSVPPYHELTDDEIDELKRLALAGLEARERRAKALDRLQRLGEDWEAAPRDTDPTDLDDFISGALPWDVPEGDTDPGREERDKLDRLMELEMRLYDIEPEPPSPVAPASELVGRALAFVRRKYVARPHRDILYIEAAQDDLAKEFAIFAAAELTRLQEKQQELVGLLKDGISLLDEARAEVIPDLNNRLAEKDTEIEWLQKELDDIGSYYIIRKDCQDALAAAQARIAELEKALRKIVERHEFGGEHLNIARAALSPEAKEK
jgi:hypothetical protein